MQCYESRSIEFDRLPLEAPLIIECQRTALSTEPDGSVITVPFNPNDFFQSTPGVIVDQRHIFVGPRTFRLAAIICYRPSQSSQAQTQPGHWITLVPL
jgi:hypothetical protein